MDLISFKLDIDELVTDYARDELTTLADMKRVWLAKKFSYIYEARPTLNPAVFMQSLFLYALGHLVAEDAISRRLAGLYCLYCLYETQPYKPCFKIYLSVGELKGLKELMIDAKLNAIRVVPALVKRMLDKNMFMFGSVDISGGSVTQNIEDITKLQNKRVKIAYDKLLLNTRIEDYIHMDLGAKLNLESFKKLSGEYAKSKESALREASATVDVESIKHIAENMKLVGDRVEDIVKDWDSQKEAFYNETGVGPRNEMVAVDEFEELEQLLCDSSMVASSPLQHISS